MKLFLPNNTRPSARRDRGGVRRRGLRVPGARAVCRGAPLGPLKAAPIPLSNSKRFMVGLRGCIRSGKVDWSRLQRIPRFCVSKLPISLSPSSFSPRACAHLQVSGRCLRISAESGNISGAPADPQHLRPLPPGPAQLPSGVLRGAPSIIHANVDECDD